MNVKRILCFLVVCLCTCYALHAQDTIEVSRTPVAVQITFDPYELPKTNVNNIIIREIAKDVIKNLRNTQLIVRAALKSFLITDHGVTYLKISLDSFELSGDHYYRKFSFSGVMKPSWITITVQLRLIRDSLIVNEFKNLTFAIKKNDSIVIPALKEEPGGSSLWHSIDNISFYYNETDLSAFNQRKRLIDDYYASAAIADSLEPVMNSMDFKRTNMFPQYLIRIEEINKIEQLIRNRNFEQELTLQLFDPKGLARKYNDLMRFSRSSAMTFESALDTIPFINSTLSTDSLILDFLAVIQRYMRWSFLINERNSSIYREFLDRFYDLNAFDNDEKVFIKLISRAYPGSDADSVFREVLVKLKKMYHQKAGVLSAGSQYAEAVGLLDHLMRLENRYGFLQDTLAGQSARLKAAYGIYSSYIGVAQNSMRMGNNRIAKWYLDKACQYVLANPLLNLSDTLYRKTLLEYHLTSLTLCDNMTIKLDFEGAMECYKEFLQSLDPVSGSILAGEIEQRMNKAREGMILNLTFEVKRFIRMEKSDSALFIFDQAVALKKQVTGFTTVSDSIDSLRPVIEQYRYEYMIMEIEKFNNKRDFSSAYAAFKQAEKLAEQQHYPADPVLDSLYRRIFPAYIEEQLARARPLIWNNQFVQAVCYADSIENSLKETGFAEDPEIRSALYSYRVKIRERVCWHASETIDVLMIRAQRNTMNRNYLRALSLLDSALLVIRSNPGCLLQKEKVEDTVTKYLPAKHYQEMLIRIEGDISLGLYDGLVVLYIEAGQYFKKNSIQKFELEYIPVFDYVTRKNRESFTCSVFHYYENKREATEAFRYLKLLRKQGFPVRDAKEILMLMGIELARMDYKADPLKDPAVLVEKYTERDKWFDNFATSYLREWKKLKMEDRD